MYTKAEINLAALTHNLDIIRSNSPNKEVLAVVKANAYGHSSEIVAPHLHSLGVRNFAVSTVNEADSLRKIIPSGDILILGMTPALFIESVIMNNYIQTIVSVEHGRELSCFAESMNKTIRCHIKIDTGMTRFGISTLDEMQIIMNLRGLEPIAAFTHLSCADSLEDGDVEFTLNQQAKLVEFADKYNLPYHSQNSAGIFNHSDFGGNMVRAGISLYGLIGREELRPVMSLKSVVAQVREVAAGVPVSYCRSYVTDCPKRLAVIPAGYADGYSRLLSNRGRVRINGGIAQVCGRVCMDYIIVDVSGIDVKVGDDVLIYGGNCGETSIEHIAGVIGTIPYEVTCAVSARVQRIAVDK
jgi:alanine racemase